MKQSFITLQVIKTIISYNVSLLYYVFWATFKWPTLYNKIFNLYRQLKKSQDHSQIIPLISITRKTMKTRSEINFDKESTLFFCIESDGLPIKHHYGFNAVC